MPSKFRLLMVWLFAACLLSAQTRPTPAKAKATPPANEQLYNFRGRLLTSGTDVPIASAQINIITALKYTPGDMEAIRNLRSFPASTDQQGEFSVPLPAGDYTYTVTIEGYALDDAIRKEFTITAGKTPERLTIRMLKAATISGVVQDADGNPVEGVAVRAITVAIASPAKFSEQTKADGKFTIESALPGSYVIRADMPRPAQGATSTFVNTYYPGTADSFAAAEVALYGVDVPNVRIRMQKAVLRTVSGRVTGQESNSFAAETVRLESVEDDSRVAFSLGRVMWRIGTISADGTFQIINVPPGKYTATVQGDRKRIMFPLAAEQIMVSDHDIDDLRMTVVAGGVFAGKVVGVDGVLPSKWATSTSLQGRNVAGPFGTPLTINKDGTFLIDGVPEGKYRFAMSSPSGFTVSSVEIGGRKYEGGKFPFEIPGSKDVVIRVKAGGATIQGTLAGSRNPDQPVTGEATVMEMSWFNEGVFYQRKAPLAKNGSFSITNLEPGRYLVCAWSDPDERVVTLLQGPNPPVQRLEQLCKTVDLKADASESVELRLTSVGEVSR
jgi:hypothetical protein